MKHTGAEIIVRLLEKKGIEIVAGIPGSANFPLYKALHDSKIKHVLVRQEQGAEPRAWHKALGKLLFALPHQGRE